LIIRQKTKSSSDSWHHPALEVIATNVSRLIRSMISQNKSAVRLADKALGTAASAI